MPPDPRNITGRSPVLPLHATFRGLLFSYTDFISIDDVMKRRNWLGKSVYNRTPALLPKHSGGQSGHHPRRQNAIQPDRSKSVHVLFKKKKISPCSAPLKSSSYIGYLGLPGRVCHIRPDKPDLLQISSN